MHSIRPPNFYEGHERIHASAQCKLYEFDKIGMLHCVHCVRFFGKI